VTKRLVLRPPEPADTDAIYRGIANLNVVRMLDNPPWPYLRSDAEALIAQVARADDRELNLGMTLDGTVIGMVGIRKRNGAPFLGYWLAEPYWGRGYTTEAGRALTRHFFAIRDEERLTSGALLDNPASIRILTALGFEETGRGLFHSRIRNESIPHMDAVLSRERFLRQTP
jgi:RimJ/RimL family protein N-acetyltransferase